MEDKNICILRLYSGEMIIGEWDLSDDPNNYYVIKNPRSIMMMPTMRGDLQIGLKPVCAPFNSEKLKKSLSIAKNQVMFEINYEEIDNELMNGYKSEISGIKIASTADTLAINSMPSAGGDFVL